MDLAKLICATNVSPISYGLLVGVSGVFGSSVERSAPPTRSGADDTEREPLHERTVGNPRFYRAMKTLESACSCFLAMR